MELQIDKQNRKATKMVLNKPKILTALTIGALLFVLTLHDPKKVS